MLATLRIEQQFDETGAWAGGVVVELENVPPKSTDKESKNIARQLKSFPTIIWHFNTTCANEAMCGG